MYRYIGIFLDGPLVLLLPCHWENRVNSNFPFGWHRGPLVRPDGTLGSAACLVRPISLFSWPVCVSFVCSNLLLHWQLFFSVLPQFSFWKFLFEIFLEVGDGPPAADVAFWVEIGRILLTLRWPFVAGPPHIRTKVTRVCKTRHFLI